MPENSEISNQDYAIALLMTARDAIGNGYLLRAGKSITEALLLLEKEDGDAIDKAVLKIMESETL